MKTNLTLFIMLFPMHIFAQVGIGTTTPQETLHVNGTLRITTTNQETVNTIKIGGLDVNGTYREITIGENLSLRENVLSAANTSKYTFGEITLPSGNNDNIDLRIAPGEENHGKNIIRIHTLSGTGGITIRSIKAGEDGQHVWLYPQVSTLSLTPNHAGASPGNAIELNNKTGTDNRREMIELVYDSVFQKWIIMQWHK
jgi:hypothetical protein